MKIIRLTLAPILFAFILLTAAPAGQEQLARLVAEARTRAITPRPNPPHWVDWERIKQGLAFYERHDKAIGGVLATSALVETYAAVDIAPVLMRTGRLAHDYNKRIEETGEHIDLLLQPESSFEKFIAENYKSAVELGELHKAVAASMTPKDLGWTASERVPVNQQAYAFVLYSFAWQPLESLKTAHEVDLTAEAAGVEGWCHLWSVLGYAMGVDEQLLPTTYARAAEVIPLLRGGQYAKTRADVPQGVPVLLSGELRMLLAKATHGAPQSPPEAQRGAAQLLADSILLSPELVRALGLSEQPAGDLMKLLRSTQ